MSDAPLPYRRVLLKLSGEALMGDLDYGIEPTVIQRMAAEIGQAMDDLPDTLRATLTLVVLEGFAYRDAAEILDWYVDTLGFEKF